MTDDPSCSPTARPVGRALIEILLIVVALALVVACGAFVAAEFAFVTVDRSTVDRAAEGGDRGARGVQHGAAPASRRSSRPRRSASRVTNLLIGFLAEPAIADLVAGPLESVGVPEGAVPAIALAIALDPRHRRDDDLRRARARRTSRSPGRWRPRGRSRASSAASRRAPGRSSRFFNGTANAILRRIGDRAAGGAGLGALARGARPRSCAARPSRARSSAATAALLQRSLAFGERRAHEIMTPRGRVATVAEDDPVAAVVERRRASGRSRFPVLGDGGAFIGHRAHQARRRRAVRAARRRRRSREVMDPPVLVPASLELDDLLDTLRARRAADGARRRRVRQRRRPRHARGPGRGDRRRGPRRARRGRGRRPAASADGSWTLPGLLRPDEIRRRGRRRSCPRTRTTRRSAA